MKLLIIIFFGTYFISTNAQDLEAKLTDSLSLAAETFVGIDYLKNLYYINDNLKYQNAKQLGWRIDSVGHLSDSYSYSYLCGWCIRVHTQKERERVGQTEREKEGMVDKE